MRFLDQLFRRKRVFSMQASDAKMWQASRASGIAPRCECLEPQFTNRRFSNLKFHADVQDTACEGWELLESLIEKAASERSKAFAPGLEMPTKLWSQIATLPPSIAKLKFVKKLYFYGSHLVRIPPEIGDMTSLEELDLYTSYRLHWLPFYPGAGRSLLPSRTISS